ncbi:MAG: tannase/feruloyl esterase family alpha/beta hydrolase, partial [Proteobacteria bacterium]
TWNGRYFQNGCGGFCGMIRMEQCADAQALGFAVASNNMGHVGHFWRDALWGGVKELREDYGGRSTHVTAVAAKAIITAYYGVSPAFSYFRGCSTGGREGLYEAQHHPEDFDGIIAGDPAFPGRLGALANNWDANHLLDENHQPVFTQAKLELLNQAVLKECDALDTLADGIIEDPRRCRFDPRTIECPPGTDKGDCLTAQQVHSAIALYQGPRNSKGEKLTPGASPYGSELAWNGESRRSVADGYLKYLAFPEPRPDFSYRDFNWNTDPALIRDQTALYDPVAPGTAPDLSAFHAAGGRLIAYHGWADPGVTPEGMLDYYGHVAAAEGGYAATQDWFRLFMLPGMHHCRGGDAPNTFDFLGKIMAWVEKGEAPNGVIATQFLEDGKTVQRTRPLYAYPTVARYTGQGDVNDAANWQPVTPDSDPDDRLDWIWAPAS